MKIKKIQVGKNSGEILELTPEEKVQPTLQDGIIDHEWFQNKVHVWLKEVTDVVVRATPKGDPINKKWQNNNYRSSGVCIINRRDLAKDYLLQPLKCRFELNFQDGLDSLGQPDTEVTSLHLEMS